jgi:glyoxylase-like metal-dependent hydrolase (beta-lactamase superfamily II)
MNTSFHTLKIGWTRCYLLKASDGYLLIDTGFPEYYSIFLERLSQIGIDLSQIKWLLLTHHHDDHAGFAAKLVEETKAQVIVHRDAVLPLSRGVFEFPGKIMPVNPIVEAIFRFHGAITRRTFHFSPLTLTDKDIILSANDSKLLRNIGIEGKILCTPGHTADSISVLLADGNAFVGDLATNFLNLLGVGYRPPYYENIHEVIQGWQELIELDAKMIYPAHGRAFPIGELDSRVKKFDKAQF